MTSNTLWTQQMLNILISWLRDHTHTHSGSAAPAHSHLSQRRSKTTALPTTPNTLVPSSPALFTTLLFFRLNLSAVGPFGLLSDRQYWRLSCHTCLCYGRRSGGLEMDRHLICCSCCSPLGRLIPVVSTRNQDQQNQLSLQHAVSWLPAASTITFKSIIRVITQ